MAKLAIRRAHDLTAQEASERAKLCLEALLRENPKLKGKVRWSSDGSSADVKGRGFKGQLVVDASAVNITASLSLLAVPFKAAVENTIVSTLDELFPEPGA